MCSRRDISPVYRQALERLKLRRLIPVKRFSLIQKVNMQSVALLLIGIQLVYADTHSYQYFYTATSGLPNFPEFVAVGMVNGEQINYYDSSTMEAVVKADWVKGIVNPTEWKNIWLGSQQWYKNNLPILINRFNKSDIGVHTFQLMYSCEWDDQTGAKGAFRQFGYDGEDFLSLDLKEMRYISPVQQGIPTVQKWNNDQANLEYFRNYFGTECIEWLKKYLLYGKRSLEKTVSPQVSLLQKDSSSPVTCHVTGFYPKEVSITWQRNGQDHDEDVDLGELLPNEDGTFQKTSTLRVTADEKKKNQYSCVVEHQDKTIREILTENSVPIGIIVGVVVALILLVVSGVVGFVVYRRKKGFKPVPQNQSSDNSSAGSS